MKGVRLFVRPAEQLEALLAEHRGRVLLAVRYGAPASGTREADHPYMDVPNRVLGDAPWAEIWVTTERAACWRRGDLAWGENGGALFGCKRRRIGEDIEGCALETYREALALLEERGYPWPLRVWNYLPGINEDQHGIDRYKLFNAGRARAFEERYGEAAERHFPAATAVGTTGDSLIVCFASSRAPGAQIENPRQISAYRYPPCYGPKSPSFARGTVAPEDWGRAFFLSGTASVVGHRTMHLGDPLRQLEETLGNIGALLDIVATRMGRRHIDVLRFDLLKTYVRHPEQFPAIRSALERHLDPATPAIYLMADICRSDLLLEIEGVVL